MTRRDSNVLVLQSGGPTPVLNRSLYGVVAEASADPRVGRVYGARHGIEGVLRDDLIDLGEQPPGILEGTARQPGAALGSTRHSLTEDEMPAVLDRLDRRGIRYLHVIGGNDSAETGHRIAAAAAGAGLPLGVVNVPKTVDNDLVMTDHTPGYGSAARFIALATLGCGLDAEAMARVAPITIIEVMGRDAGWLPAAAALARREERDAPHVLGLPEVPVDEERFLGAIEDAYRRHGFAVVVMSEKTSTSTGVLGASAEPNYVDTFGHEYYDPPARYVARVLAKRLGVRVRDEEPGTIQRSFSGAASAVDGEEAEAAGRAAVRYALEGVTSVMVSFERPSTGPYACEITTAPLAEVAGAVRTLPPEYLDPERYLVTDAFLDYARPLVGDPLPVPSRLV